VARRARGEEIATSLLVAAGVRRNSRVTARTQWRRLPAAQREAAKRILAAWYGGTYRGQALTPSKTRRRRAAYRQAQLAAPTVEARPGVAAREPLEDVWDSAATDLERTWEERAAGRPGRAPVGEVAPDGGDLDAEWDAAGADLAAAWAAGETPVGELAGGGPSSAPAGYSDDEIHGYEVDPHPPVAAGHYSGPAFATPWEAAESMRHTGIDTIARIVWDGRRWRVWFPDVTP